MKTLLALIEKPGHVCFRYRVAAFAPMLLHRGWQVESAPIARGFLPFLKQMEMVRKADAVLLQRRLLTWWQVRLLRKNAKILLFDIDDAIFFRDSNSTRGHESPQRLSRFRAIVRRADAVLAGNSFLVEQASRFTPAERVHFIPTCVDPTLYHLSVSRRSRDCLRLVWIGSQSTMTSLDDIQPALAAATCQVPGLILRVVCDAFPKLAGVNVEPRTWSEATEAAELADADVGISWLPEHPWSRGKCGLKVLQYMAAGLPVLANPYGVHEPMVLSGETGMLAGTTAAWTEAIVRLATDPNLRSQMGQTARQKVEADYSTQTWGPRFANILDTLRPAKSG